ncbi:hypothetical protein MASR1M32_17540 [Rhodobacter sp.]
MRRGLDAIALAAALVASGRARAVLAGGAESHSLRPLRAMPDPEGGPPTPYKQAPFTPWPGRDPDMAEAAAALAQRLGISRAEADAYAVESHRRAAAADFRAEIVPVAGQLRDAFTRALTPALAGRAKVLTGPVTAANTAVAADAAAFVLVVAEDPARGRGLRIAGCSTLVPTRCNPASPRLRPSLRPRRRPA